MVAELFQAAGAKTTMLPGSEILDALAQDNLDAADYTGPAVNLALGFQKVAKYVSMGPAGFMSIYQPVDLMDITVAMPAWQALSPAMQAFLEDRSEERRVGKECVSTGRSRWRRYHKKKKT